MLLELGVQLSLNIITAEACRRLVKAYAELYSEAKAEYIAQKAPNYTPYKRLVELRSSRTAGSEEMPLPFEANSLLQYHRHDGPPTLFTPPTAA